MSIYLHMGRAWTGHTTEDACPCPKAACGLAVPGEDPTVVCAEHNPTDWRDSKTMRQMHQSKDCPADTPVEGPVAR